MQAAAPSSIVYDPVSHFVQFSDFESLVMVFILQLVQFFDSG
jgi:hypothetical protein